MSLNFISNVIISRPIFVLPLQITTMYPTVLCLNVYLNPYSSGVTQADLPILGQ